MRFSERRDAERINNQDLLRFNIDYDYPEDLDLRPGRELHDKIVGRVLDRAQRSHSTMSSRHQDWMDIDASLKMFVQEPGKKPSKTKGIGESIVMPVSFAALETFTTYMTAAFLQDPIFKYRGVGPEDDLGAHYLEQKIALDSRKNRVGLALHTHWRDGFSYGVGIVSPTWKKRFGNKTAVESTGFMSKVGDIFGVTSRRKVLLENQLIYEGNELFNIDPYNFLPDTSVSIHEVQDGEFVGWLDESSYYLLLGLEDGNPEEYFNVKYLYETDGRGQLSSKNSRLLGKEDMYREHSRNVDLIHMCLNLIPNEWGLGSKTTPEKWLFTVGADKVLIRASPINLDHGRFPIEICAPIYDGYSANPQSIIGSISDIQATVNFMYSSHIQNVRKVLNDSIVLDPKMVNIFDVANPEAGKIIRLRRSSYGKVPISNVIQQLQVSDITRGNVADAQYLSEVVNQSLGTTDAALGVVRNTGPRISATAAQGARTATFSRLEKYARLIDLQSHQGIAEQFASNTIQLMEMETFIQVLGEYAERMSEDPNATVDNGRALVNPLDLVVDYDILAHTGSIPGSEDPNLWMSVMEIAGANPYLNSILDWGKLFKHTVKQMGAKSIDDFILSGKPPTVMPDEEVQRQVQAGNAVPLEEAA